MRTLKSLYYFLRDTLNGERQRRIKAKIAARKQQSELTDHMRELKQAEQELCQHNFVRVFGTSQGDISFLICQRCQKIGRGEHSADLGPFARYMLSGEEAYPDSGRPESELYEMPLEDLKALAEATQ